MIIVLYGHIQTIDLHTGEMGERAVEFPRDWAFFRDLGMVPT